MQNGHEWAAQTTYALFLYMQPIFNQTILHCIIDHLMNYHTDTIHWKNVSNIHRQLPVLFWLSAWL